MLITSTPAVEGRAISQYDGSSYEQELKTAKDIALDEMGRQAQQLGSNDVIAVDLDYETVGQGSMLMVSASGTAVRLTDRAA